MAFGSNESGRPEVFVQSFPERRGRTQVSTGGGAQIRWSGDGKEIFYVAPDGKMMAASIAFGVSPEVKLPVPLFQTHLATGTNVLGFKPQYAVSRDGRFLLNQAETLFSIEVEAPLDPAGLAALLHRRVAVYDKDREGHYNLISALHKAIRGSDPQAALYYLARMLTAGEEPLYLLRRSGPDRLRGSRRYGRLQRARGIAVGRHGQQLCHHRGDVERRCLYRHERCVRRGS